MIEPITKLTPDEVLEYTGINLSEELKNDKPENYIRRVTFLIENRIKQYTLFHKIEENEEIMKTAICMQIEYQMITGELQRLAFVDVNKMHIGDVEAFRKWVISTDVIDFLEVNNMLYVGIR